MVTRAQKRVERMKRYAAKTTPSTQVWEFEGYHDEWYPFYQDMGSRFSEKMQIKFNSHPFEINVQVLDDHAMRTVNKSGYIKIRVTARKIYPR